MEAQKGLHRFDFYDDNVLDQEVEAETTIKAKPFVFDWQRNLPAHSQATQMKLLHEAGFIDGLE